MRLDGGLPVDFPVAQRLAEEPVQNARLDRLHEPGASIEFRKRSGIEFDGRYRLETGHRG